MLDLIMVGKTPVVEDGVVALVGQVAASGKMSFTADAGTALRENDIPFVCVGTPPAANSSQDQGATLRLAAEIGQATMAKSAQHLVVFRSTFVPGSVEDVVRPIVEEHSGKKAGVDFHRCFQVEFLRRGTVIVDYDKSRFALAGANHSYPCDQLHALFGHLPCKFIKTSVRAAEMMEYCRSNFYALKMLLLARYLTAPTNIVKVRNPLLLDDPNDVDLNWTPDRVPADFNLERGPADPFLAKVADQLGLAEWYVWWGNNVFIYDQSSVVSMFAGVSRSQAQFGGIVQGLSPGLQILEIPANQRQAKVIEQLRLHLLIVGAALAVSVSPLVASLSRWFWLRREVRGSL